MRDVRIDGARVDFTKPNRHELRRVGRTVHAGLATTLRRSSAPMVTYLPFFAAGDVDIQRGGMALAALRQRIVKAVFRQLLRTWAAENRNGNVTADDFVTRAEGLSGQELDAFFHAWLSAADPPPRTAEYGLD